MTAPTSPSPDSLAAVVADLRAIPNEFDAQKEWENALADRIERLDAEMRKELKIATLKASTSLANNLCPDHRDKQQGKSCLGCEIEQLRAKLAACEREWTDAEIDRGIDAWFATDTHIAFSDGLPNDEKQISFRRRFRAALEAALASRAAPNDISTPRPTDCADIREGRVTVLARDQKGEACMTMVKR